jgi:hypothetical protein
MGRFAQLFTQSFLPIFLVAVSWAQEAIVRIGIGTVWQLCNSSDEGRSLLK